MVRKLVVVLASAWLVFVPLAAHALGFGNIKLNSALNEPFNADIELLSATQADIDTLQVKLASQDAFLRAGIDRPHFLTDLKFEVKERGGDFYIHASSPKPIREPFVNFLLEMSWDNGRMLREYTMLLDPPGRLLRQPAPAVIETPTTEPADTIIRPQQPLGEEVPIETTPPESVVAVEPVMPRAGEEIPLESAIAPESVEPAAEPEVVVAEDPAAMAEMEESVYEDPFVDDGTPFPRIRLTAYSEAPANLVTGELDYGVTKKGDNAWTIAQKLQQGRDSVSIYQVMMALLRSNPDAFVDGNIHRLKVGQVLRIDDPSLLTAMSKQQAANKYINQTRNWNEYRQAMAKRTGRQPIVAGESKADSVAQPEPAGELTLASPDGRELQAGAGASEEAMSNDLVALQDELRQVQANAATMRERNSELNQKLRELEEELTRLQRSLSVKDDELAALQHRLAELNTQAKAEPETPRPMPEAAPAEPEPAPKEEPVAEEEEPQPVEPQHQAQVEPPATKPVPAPVALTSSSEPKGMVEEYLDMVKGIFDSSVDVVAGMTKSLGGNSLLLYVAAPVLLVLIILMLIVVLRRKKAEGSYQESILSGGPSTVTSEESGVDSGESSFLSDFAVSGAGAIQTEDSEVDPLTEADVFMAYGRYEAAEELLQEAIEKEPSRKELKLKLLEVYNSTGNSNAFENLAEEFYASLGGEAESDPMWEKVVGMGKELAPNNPLFAAGAAAFMASSGFNEEPAVSLSDSQVMDIGLETGVFQSEDFASGGESEAGSDLDFNLDFGSGSSTEESAGGETDIGGMDFNLDLDGESAGSGDSGLDFSRGGSEESTSTDEGGAFDLNFDMGGGESGAGTDNGGLDFNLDMGSESAGAGMEEGGLSFDLGGEENAAASGGGFDFNLDGGDDNLSLDVGGEGSEEPGMAIGTGGLDFDTGDQGGGSIGFDLDTSDSDMSLGGNDEVGTKLDLAKAYIDMGDPDGARSILDEVLDEGNDSQKQEAQQLIQQIA